MLLSFLVDRMSFTAVRMSLFAKAAASSPGFNSNKAFRPCLSPPGEVHMTSMRAPLTFDTGLGSTLKSKFTMTLAKIYAHLPMSSFMLSK